MKKIVAALCISVPIGIIVMRNYMTEKNDTKPVIDEAVEAKHPQKKTSIATDIDAQPTPTKKEVVSPKAAADTQETVAMAEAIQTKLTTDKEFSKIGEVSNVDCSERECKILIEAKGDNNGGVAMGIALWMSAHPEYGTTSTKDDVPDNPRAALITINLPEEPK